MNLKPDLRKLCSVNAKSVDFDFNANFWCENTIRLNVRLSKLNKLFWSLVYYLITYSTFVTTMILNKADGILGYMKR